MHTQKSTFRFIHSQKDLNSDPLVYPLSTLSLHHTHGGDKPMSLDHHVYTLVVHNNSFDITQLFYLFCIAKKKLLQCKIQMV